MLFHARVIDQAAGTQLLGVPPAGGVLTLHAFLEVRTQRSLVRFWLNDYHSLDMNVAFVLLSYRQASLPTYGRIACFDVGNANSICTLSSFNGEYARV